MSRWLGVYELRDFGHKMGKMYGKTPSKHLPLSTKATKACNKIRKEKLKMHKLSYKFNNIHKCIMLPPALPTNVARLRLPFILKFAFVVIVVAAVLGVFAVAHFGKKPCGIHSSSTIHQRINRNVQKVCNIRWATLATFATLCGKLAVATSSMISAIRN